MNYPAHIRKDNEGEIVQTVQTHCRNTAAYAGACLRDIGLEDAGALAGLVHDMGKFKEEFARYLEHPDAARGTINHSFAGFRFLMERYHGESPLKSLTAELIAYAAGGHHGLFDCVDGKKRSGFLHRMTKDGIGYHESREIFLIQCASAAELDEQFANAHAALQPVYTELADLTQDPEESAFFLGLLARLLLSAVIEADRRDTAEFMSGYIRPPAPADMAAFWGPYLNRVEEKLSDFPQESAINRARREISDRCRRAADEPGGIYRLNVPTGAGKTLSALRYALAHGQKWGKQRLIFASPLLSILDQTAATIREYLRDDSIILEHHSNVIATVASEELDPRELAVESWNAPVIITTLVQLLNTLFDGRTTSIRRFQSLCNSVIVIDEVQTVPPKMLSLFNLAMDFLAEVCGTTVLLCSATQPCLEKTRHPLRSCRGDLVPYDTALWTSFRRTIITDVGGRTLERIVELVRDSLEGVQSLLVVCNKKAEAVQLFRALRDCAEESCHLSASMCTAHRQRVLSRLKTALDDKKKCLCVATQVIEAGVDISFARVIRLSAGMDSVIQAAGRCNRHGEQQECAAVYVVSCLDERLEKLPEIRDARKATDQLLDAYRRDPERFDSNLSSDQAMAYYYKALYDAMPQGYQDFYVKSRNRTLLELLSGNEKNLDETAAYLTQFCLMQAFRTAGALFQVFESDTRDLVVPYSAGEDLITELESRSDRELTPQYLAGWEKRARPYTVAAYDWQLRRLGNAVAEYAGIAVLNPDFYDNDTGLTLSPGDAAFLEV